MTAPAPTVIGSAAYSAVHEAVELLYQNENQEYIAYAENARKKSQDDPTSVIMMKFLKYFGIGIAVMILAVVVGAGIELATNPSRLTDPESVDEGFTTGTIVVIVAILLYGCFVIYRAVRFFSGTGRRREERLTALMSTAPVEIPREELEQRVYREINRLRNGKEKRDSWMSGKESMSWLIGAIGEMDTADILASAPSSMLVAHDLVLLDPSGATVANIDHLVFGDHFTAMIDTKIWRAAPTFEVSSHTGTFRVTSPQHAKSIKNCRREAETGHFTPDVLVFAVGGNGGRQLLRDHAATDGQVQVTELIDNYNGQLKDLTDWVPVFFIPQQRLVQFLTRWNENRNARAAHPATAQEILAPDNNVRLSTTPGLDLSKKAAGSPAAMNLPSIGDLAAWGLSAYATHKFFKSR